MIEYLESLVADIAGRDKTARIRASFVLDHHAVFAATAAYQTNDGTWIELASARRDTRSEALTALAAELLKLREEKQLKEG